MKKKTNDNTLVESADVSGSVADYIAKLTNSDLFGPQIVGRQTTPPEGGSYCSIDILIPPLQQMLVRRGISRLYSHQHSALLHIFNNENVIIATATASGKSLIYNLPVLQHLFSDNEVKALYLFPLKALARDQVKTVKSLYQDLPFIPQGVPDEIAGVYDGDTTAYRRRKLREKPSTIVVSNPDMLHLSILPYHEKWGHFLANLKYVIIDEVHTYKGVFGAHVAWIIERLRRLCSLYGTKPIFILTSATVGNPQELASNLVGESFACISENSAEQGQKDIILINPVDSAAGAATMLLEAAVSRNLRTIIYSQSRKMTELITMWAGQRLKDKQKMIASYRAGFLPEDRRDIEDKLSRGELLAVISTSALELGIDIGNLDICILVGYPGSIMATRQRGGRVGRSKRDSLVIMLGHEDALDQYFMRHPKEFFSKPVEPIVLDPTNIYIVSQQIVCAAAEEPLRRSEALMQNRELSSVLHKKVLSSELLQSADGNTWFASRKYPQRDVNIRGGGRSFHIYTSPGQAKLGEVDGNRVFKECHAGAVYLHMAETYLVDRLDLEQQAVFVSPSSPPYFTRVITEKSTEILEVASTRSLGITTVAFGRLKVTERVTGYSKIQLRTMRTLARIPLDLPPQIFETEGFWIIIPESVNRECIIRRLHFMGGIHALEHAVIGILPLFVLCDRNDIGGIAYPFHQQLDSPAVFIYDGYAGGVGLARKSFDVMEELLAKTSVNVATCNCDFGCPACVHSPKCGSGNRPIDKESALFVLDTILNKDKKVIQSKQLPKIDQPTEISTLSTPYKQKALPENFCVFDLETQRSAQEVGGWNQAARMGISVAVLYDNNTGIYKEYLEKDIQRLINDLFGFDLVIGFNNKRFDNKVLSAYTSSGLGNLPSLDILEVIYNQLGYRLSLDHLAEATLGQVKQGNGLHALAWYKKGEINRLLQYCRKDVELTRDLFLFGLRQHHLLFTNKAGQRVRLPVNFNEAVEKVLTKKSNNAYGQTRFP